MAKINFQKKIFLLIGLLISFKYTAQVDTSGYLKEKSISFLFDCDSSTKYQYYKGYPDNGALFLMGETHDQPQNLNIFSSSLDNLYKYNNVRYIFLEQPVSFEYDLNSFFSTGDSSYLNEILFHYPQKASFLKSTFSYLYQKNRGLSDSCKLIVKCIDAEVNQYYSILVLYKMKTKKQTPSNSSLEVFKCIDKLYYKRRVSKKKMKKEADHLFLELKTNEEKYKAILGEDFNLCIRIVHALQLIAPQNKSGLTDLYFDRREEFLAENVTISFLENRPGNYFCQIGAFHIPLKEVNVGKSNQWKSMAYRLAFHGQINIVSTLINYPDERTKNNNSPSAETALFEKYIKNQNILLKINENETPLKVMSEYFQYLLFVK